MDWKRFARARLGDNLDSQGDLAPPWERFPDYERYTIGWRMGSGEDWMGMWHVFLEQLGRKSEIRLAYLRRHPPAPMSWADTVYRVLHPKDARVAEDDAKAAGRRAALLDQGLIASDIAYRTWLAQQDGVCWPWQHSDTPDRAARYDTRRFWFWSRQVSELRSDPAWVVPALPEKWRDCAGALASGEAGAIERRQGLPTLARMLCAGQVTAPWQLGLSPADFADSFEDDMGYVDAFRLWSMSAFDDDEQIRRCLEASPAPREWMGWVAEQMRVM
jgi:hypothetical protein